jgi:hypothetical protein
MIFVFGSNEAGIHGAGAALEALNNHGAVMGQGFGPQGSSFAIPTKGEYTKRDGITKGIGRSLPFTKVVEYVGKFLEYAALHPDMTFQVTRIGCGYAGFMDDDIASLFTSATPNCKFDVAWQRWLGDDRSYWGTFSPTPLTFS